MVPARPRVAVAKSGYPASESSSGSAAMAARGWRFARRHPQTARPSLRRARERGAKTRMPRRPARARPAKAASSRPAGPRPVSRRPQPRHRRGSAERHGESAAAARIGRNAHSAGTGRIGNGREPLPNGATGRHGGGSDPPPDGTGERRPVGFIHGSPWRARSSCRSPAARSRRMAGPAAPTRQSWGREDRPERLGCRAGPGASTRPGIPPQPSARL